MANKNALAELESELRFSLTDIRGECCEASYEAVKKAQRIVFELAKVQDEEAALFSMKYLNPDEARRIARQRKENCILKCRAIAEEGVKDGK